MYYIGDYVLANTWSLKKYRSIIYLLTMIITMSFDEIMQQFDEFFYIAMQWYK